ncbi:uncharacterized protein LOC119600516 [Lucilia sericata]|uniref:uncharacterized protein LOC119600516 n=1 Tax=Lucilia sericata TaxID=13632 RepID=UPI0018A818AE|nr:uncharacterized protein LOC119600516 [Lucilia sericata]
MDELSDYTSPVVEFKASHSTDRQFKLIDSSTATDPLPPKIDASVETQTKCSQETQTETYQALAKSVDERKLANWLQKIYPNVEKELLKGCTPALESQTNDLSSHDIEIQPYQKISLPTLQNSQGLAIWLSVYTNNAPVLVVTTVAPHDDWCEHVDQYLKLFVPKRVPNANFVTYNEVKSIPIKSCLKSLCTNPFNKNIFAGSSFDGDIYIWRYEQHYQNHPNNRNNIDINEMYHTTLLYGFAVALDWISENTLLTAHSNGYVVQWHLGKEIIKEAEYLVKAPANASTEICTLLALSLNNFVVGTKDGSVFYCTCSSLSTIKRHLEIVSLKKHLFMTSTLLKSHINGHIIVISCDLSGQVYFHDLRNVKDDTETTVTQIPLPFTSTIACSRDGSFIYSPGEDGSLECYSLFNGLQNTVKGALKGKGNFIKSSDNGCWLITGLYENEFQIFSVEN